MFFTGCTTVEATKKAYRELAMRWHPDRPGGDTETMQRINAEYHAKLKSFDGHETVGDDNKQRQYHYNERKEQDLMEKLGEILRVKMVADVYMIGSWLWIRGDTKPVKDQLKALGCKWHGDKQCWYWHAPENKSWSRGKGNFQSMAMRYGWESYKTDDKGSSVQ